MMLLSSSAQGLADATDGVAWQAWLQAGLFVVLAAILGALLLVLLEVRKLAREWGAFARAARDRTGPLVDHATNAVRNLDHVCRVAREGADRLEGSLNRLAGEADKAAGHARVRLGELAALADFVQAEAEDAALDVATKVRLARGGGLARWIGRGGRPAADRDERERSESPPEAGHDGLIAPADNGTTRPAEAPPPEAGDGPRPTGENS